MVLSEMALHPVTKFRVRSNMKEKVLMAITVGSNPRCVERVVNLILPPDVVLAINGVKQGTVLIPPKRWIPIAASPGVGLNGNISFLHVPTQCNPEYPIGTNLFEFNLNSGMETVDISCVGGLNTIMQVIFENGPIWNAGKTDRSVKGFTNKEKYLNRGIPGVFPYGCDLCTSSNNPPPCTKDDPRVRPQLEPICNVQRSEHIRGGTVSVVLQRKL